MSKTKEIGDRGEALAKAYLERHQFRIVAENWRAGRAEIDLIAWEGEVLVFVEVKSRSNISFGEPETFVSPRKQRLLVGAAAHYMEEINYDWEIRFDVIAVTYHGPAGHTIKHLKDAFFPRAF